jgi:hypothetical protein
MTDISVPIEYVEKEKGEWIDHYAECALFRVNEGKTTWQDTLTHLIIKKFINETSLEELIRLKSSA